MKKLILVVVGLIILTGCQENSQKKKDILVKKILVDNRGEAQIKSIVDSISYLQIREQKGFLFTDIDKIIVHKHGIFILDKLGSNSLLCFSKSGDFIAKFGSRGQGVGEYIRLWDFDITEQFVYLYDRHQMKMLEYDTKGTFIRELKTPFRASSFKALPNGFLFSLVKEEEEENSLLVKTDKNFQNIETILSYAKNYVDNKGSSNVFQNYKNGFLFNKSVNDSVYVLNKKGELVSAYFFDFQNNAVPQELKNNYENLVKVRGKQNYIYLMETPMFINDRYLIGESFYKGNKATVIYDLEKNESNIVQWLPEKINLKDIILPLTSFENMIVGWMDSNIYENLAEKPIFSEDYMKHLEEGGKILVFYHIRK